MEQTPALPGPEGLIIKGEMFILVDPYQQFKKELIECLERHRPMWRLNGIDLDASIMAEHLIGQLNAISSINYYLNHKDA